MKKIYGFAALSAAMLLASCSNDNEPNGLTPAADQGSCYFKVNIAAPLESTRAAEYGKVDESEYAVATVDFIVFDEAGTVMACIPSTQFTFEDQDAEADNSVANNISSLSKTITVEVTKDAERKVGSVIAVLNSPGISYTSGTTLATVRKDLLTYKTKKLKKVDGEFKEDASGTEYYVMTNSAYNVSGAPAYATDLKGHVYETDELAESDATPIYVERVAARVDLKKGDEFPTTVTEGIAKGKDENGNEVTFSVALKKVEVIYEPTKAHLVKDIDGISGFDGWDESVYKFRTHWANQPSLTFLSQAEETSTSKSDYRKVLISDATLSEDWKTTGATFYLNENVSETYPTYVVLTGKIQVNGADAEVMRLYQNGTYYTGNGALKQLCTYLGWDDYKYIYTATTEGESDFISSVEVSDVALTQTTGECYGYIKMNATKKVNVDGSEKVAVLCKNGVPVTAANANSYNLGLVKDTNDNVIAYQTSEATGKKYMAYVYGSGDTYYYTEIKAEEVGKIGVIRNHLYKITFNQISGIGTPLYDPSDELIPHNVTTQDGEPNWFFGASINIINWHVYSQGMNFSNN